MTLLDDLSRKFSRLPHQQAWILAWPMIVSGISVPLMGLADTAMLGHLDDAIFLAAVGIGSNIVALCYWMFAFLRMGTTSVTAQAMGANKPEEAMLHLSQNTALAIIIGLGLILAQSILFPFAFWVIAPSENLSQVALDYCEIRIFSAPAVLFSYVAIGWLLAQKRPKITLVVTVISNILNVVLDYIFIVLWGSEAKGAAWATLIAEYSACAAFIIAIAQVVIQQGWRPNFSVQLHHIKENLGLNRDLFIRTLALLIAINFFYAQGAKLGTEVLAANTILFQCTLFVAFFLDGYALAAETMTARAIGAKDIRSFHQASAATSIIAALIALVLSAVFLIFGTSIIYLLTDIPAVANVANDHIFWLVLMPLVSVACYALDGIFIGAGQAQRMRNAMLLSFSVYVCVWWFSRDLANHGLWLAFIIFNIFRGLTLGISYIQLSRSEAWLTKG